jgi:hypothetical protein
MPRNPFRDGNNPQEPDKLENIVNLNNRKIMRIRDESGNIIQEMVIDDRESRPDGNGGFIDIEYIDYLTDSAGNPLPENPRNLIISHSGLYIPTQEHLSKCTSRFHSSRFSRNIYVDQDGRTTGNGAICSRCDFWLITIYIALGIIGVGIFIGLLRGSGIF